MSVSYFVSVLVDAQNYHFYLNDELVDLSSLYSNLNQVHGIEFNEPDVVRIYA